VTEATIPSILFDYPLFIDKKELSVEDKSYKKKKIIKFENLITILVILINIVFVVVVAFLIPSFREPKMREQSK
jgi:hypothetical protein